MNAGDPGQFNPYAPPAAPVEAVETGQAAAPVGYRPLSPLTNALSLVLGVGALVDLALVINCFITIGAMNRIMAGQTVDQASLEAIDQRARILGGGGVVLFLATVVLFCLLMPRANRNARSFGMPMEITPGWAAGYYFVPFLCLWKPYQAMKEIWVGSATGPNPDLSVPGLLPLWWGAFLLQAFIGNISFQFIGQANTPQGLVTNSTVQIVGSIATIVGAVLAVAVIRQLATRQAVRARAG
jgi:uncharacterized protein DUF4328